MPPVRRPPRKRARTYFREWREYRDRKQGEVAALIEVDPGTLSRLESGKSPYDQDILEKLALVYGCDPEDLISINPNHTSQMAEVVNADSPFPAIEASGRLVCSACGGRRVSTMPDWPRRSSEGGAAVGWITPP